VECEDDVGEKVVVEVVVVEYVGKDGDEYDDNEGLDEVDEYGEDEALDDRDGVE
jgi:hypothetical protein